MGMKSVFKSEEGRIALMEFYDKMLSFWPVAHEERDIATRYGITHVITAGDPSLPPCVLLHGAASNAVTWIADAGVLSQRFHVIAPDLPGEVGKSAPFRPSWHDASYAFWLADVLDGLKVEKACLVGLSLGGWAALRFGVEYSDRVERMVVMSPAGIVPVRLGAVIRPVFYAMLKGGGGMQRMVFGDGQVPPEIGLFFSLIHRAYRPRFGSPPVLNRVELGRIASPVMVLAPDQDAFFPFDRAHKRLQGLDRFHLRVRHAQHGLVGMGEEILPFLLGKE